MMRRPFFGTPIGRGRSHGALAIDIPGGYLWFWIGSCEDDEWIEFQNQPLEFGYKENSPKLQTLADKALEELSGGQASRLAHADFEGASRLPSFERAFALPFENNQPSMRMVNRIFIFFPFIPAFFIGRDYASRGGVVGGFILLFAAVVSFGVANIVHFPDRPPFYKLVVTAGLIDIIILLGFYLGYSVFPPEPRSLPSLPFSLP